MARILAAFAGVWKNIRGRWREYRHQPQAWPSKDDSAREKPIDVLHRLAEELGYEVRYTTTDQIIIEPRNYTQKHEAWCNARLHNLRCNCA